MPSELAEAPSIRTAPAPELIFPPILTPAAPPVLVARRVIFPPPEVRLALVDILPPLRTCKSIAPPLVVMSDVTLMLLPA